MESIELTLAERGQVVIPKAARDALGLKPGAKLSLRVEAGRILIEKTTKLDLSKWVGQAADEALTTDQVLTQLRGRPVPWKAAKAAKPSAPRKTKRS
jgi:AbrB family looped-hinge helix DNA binding protein